MFYEAELRFLQTVLKKLQLQVILAEPEELSVRRVDLGLRAFLGLEERQHSVFYEVHRWAKPNTIYKLTDPFLCHYIFLMLPDTQPPAALLIGPYMSFSMTHQQLLEEGERFSVPPAKLSQLERYYSNVPVIADDRLLFTALNVFGETIWGRDDAFTMVDMSQEFANTFTPLPGEKENSPSEETLLNMQLMERRYAFENELMQNVSKGLSNRAEQMLSGMSKTNFEQRMTDPLRNAKNYCIICNTLMRKAAENGGVHPVYLDSASSDFARKIESLRALSSVHELMVEMIRSYCRLVRKHAMRNYSPQVRKAIMHIDSNLSGDLRLHTLAAAQSINASYLSSRFREETGQTLTEHVNRKRVELAVRLLRTTRLQIQTIAQHCGIHDVNYFTKIFKKHMGMTPKQFRENSVHI